MRIHGTEILVGVTAGLIVGVGMFVAGTIIGSSSDPKGASSRPSEFLADTPAACLDTPVTDPTASITIGQARLCREGRAVRVTLQASGLDPGARYTSWISQRDAPPACPDGSCGGPMRQIGEGVATSWRGLELDAGLQDLALTSGAQVSIVLLRPGGRAGPHAQAAFIIP